MLLFTHHFRYFTYETDCYNFYWYNVCLDILGVIVLQCGRMADTSLDRKQRKLDQMEAELLASDHEMVIGDEDLVEAENQLNMYRCARCQADFGPDVGGVCMVDQTQA